LSRRLPPKLTGWIADCLPVVWICRQEGFDTADLKEAKALLNELTEQPVASGA